MRYRKRICTMIISLKQFLINRTTNNTKSQSKTETLSTRARKSHKSTISEKKSGSRNTRRTTCWTTNSFPRVCKIMLLVRISRGSLSNRNAPTSQAKAASVVRWRINRSGCQRIWGCRISNDRLLTLSKTSKLGIRYCIIFGAKIETRFIIRMRRETKRRSLRVLPTFCTMKSGHQTSTNSTNP